MFSPIATGGVAQQPITSFNYENIGVNIDITPRTHHDDEVSLALKIDVSSISGDGLRRTADVREPCDQHRHPAARRRDEPARGPDSRRRTAHVLEGIPGLSDIPIVGRLFAHTRQRDAGNGHRPDADAAHHPRAGPDRGRSPAVPCGTARAAARSFRFPSCRSCRHPIRRSNSRNPANSHRHRRRSSRHRSRRPGGRGADHASEAYCSDRSSRSDRSPSDRARLDAWRTVKVAT